ncbi:hypothetical protein CB0940_08017 [Cercospora beticola]|uniref:C2H2-type domain-containing protein n=1 Tax=Cercospora beticola TaxID=122368 RepID=A0A2G5HQE7_CERBT|nr:hypothetical protein CB0940_08017 [Cercospora beticola]PIA94750.1 hypothetical protein CB0940_08017 [Cercospora beticola]
MSTLYSTSALARHSIPFDFDPRDSGNVLVGYNAFALTGIPNVKDPAGRDQGGAPAILEFHSEPARTGNRISCPEPGCSSTFGKRKSLYRHRRTVHHNGRHTCKSCREDFKRRDILDRHVREQHQETTDTLECVLCGKELRPRSYPLHRNTNACYNAAGISPADVLAAPVEVVRLGVELLVKFRPWGQNHHYLDWHPVPNAHIEMTNEVRELERLLHRQLIIALNSEFVEKDSSFVDALSIINVFTCQTRGWEASMVHCKALVFLAMHQIMALGKEITSFKEPSKGAVEVLRTVLLSNVPEHYVAICEDFLVRLLRMMRSAACVTGFLCFGHPKAPIIESADVWYNRWKTEICAVAYPTRKVTC